MVVLHGISHRIPVHIPFLYKLVDDGVHCISLHFEQSFQNIFPGEDLPILFTSGAEDPVGEKGKGVKAACDRYIKAGIEEVGIKLYEDCRHEILNEINRHEVYSDLLDWFEAHME